MIGQAHHGQRHRLEEMQRHLGHLRYAVHTTTCSQTAALLRRMLGEAEAEFARYSGDVSDDPSRGAGNNAKSGSPHGAAERPIDTPWLEPCVMPSGGPGTNAGRSAATLPRNPFDSV